MIKINAKVVSIGWLMKIGDPFTWFGFCVEYLDTFGRPSCKIPPQQTFESFPPVVITKKWTVCMKAV